MINRVDLLVTERNAVDGYVDLLRQAMQSQLPRRGQFHDVAWPVAVSFRVKNVARLRTCGPEGFGLALPYLAFLTEYKGLDWADGESRDLNVARGGDVDIYWVGEHLRIDYGKFKQ